MERVKLKSIERVVPEDPVQARRRKLITALDEQQKAALQFRKRPPNNARRRFNRTS